MRCCPTITFPGIAGALLFVMVSGYETRVWNLRKMFARAGLSIDLSVPAIPELPQRIEE